MFKGFKFVAIALVTLLVTGPAFAQFKPTVRVIRPNVILRQLLPPVIKPPLPLLNIVIRPSQAAAIAQGQVPDSKVVKVKLLPGGVYAVTLVANGSVTKIMVSGQDGSIL